MKTLDEIIRECADNGRLNYFSIAYHDAGWEVSYRGVAHEDHRIVTHADPVCAIRLAITDRAGEAPATPPRARIAAPKRLPAAPAAPTAPVGDIFGDLM